MTAEKLQSAERIANGRFSGASPSDIRVRNRTAVLRAVYPDKRYSRSELAKITGMSKVSTSDVVADLMSDGYLREVGYKSSKSPGKPALMLEFNTTAQAVIALDLSNADRIAGIVSDLKGNVLAREEHAVATQSVLQVEEVVDLCSTLASDSPFPLLGIGVATPGFVDECGVILEAPNLGWVNVDLAGILEGRFGCRVYVANDADCGVLAERTFAEGEPNMMYVQIARGVGAGLLVDDRLVGGGANTAGEIGHVVVDRSGPQRICGKRGCLETIIAVPALQRRRAQCSGDGEQAVVEAGCILGDVLSMVVAMTDMTHVVVSGPEELVDGRFRKAMQDRINLLAHSKFMGTVKVHGPHFKEDTALLGSVANVLKAELNVL